MGPAMGSGHVMQVHEGPASISKRGSVPLAAGMLLSNEPGCYRAGGWGIRTENLIAVNAPDDDGFFSFETITLCPIDRRLVEAAMLLAEERAWLDAYHARVEESLPRSVPARRTALLASGGLRATQTSALDQREPGGLVENGDAKLRRLAGL